MNNLFKKCNNNFKLVVVDQIKYYCNSVNSNLKLLLEKMPKEQKHIADAQKQRKKIKEKFSKYVPGRITLQVLGTGAEGAPRSLYVFSDQSRYLFNCGEGTQRLAHEHKMKLAKLEHIFITQRTWRNIGGLPGTALTIQDVGVPHITLHGPKGLEELFNATKRFVIIRDLQIEMADCTETNVFEDNVMTVNYVPIQKKPSIEKFVTVYNTLQQPRDASGTCRSQSSSRSRSPSPSYDHPRDEASEDDVDYYAYEQTGRCYAPERAPETMRLTELKGIRDETTAMNYICKLQPRPGALNLDRCVHNGVPPGPLLGRLKMGYDVTLPSGVVIKSEDVCEPDDPGPVFLVVDCPSEKYLESFVNNEAFKKHQSWATRHEDLAYLVVHFTPKHVLEDPKYRNWVEAFSPSTHHLILNETNTCMGSISVHRVQHKLNLLNETIFPILGDRGTKTNLTNTDQPTPSLKRLKTEENMASANISPSIVSQIIKPKSTPPCDRFTYASTFCNFHLRPRRGLDRSSELSLTPKDYVEETMKEDGFAEALRTLQVETKQSMNSLKIRPYPRFLFLGTGSCIPNKTRNTSGILLEASERTNIIIDCGEGTYGQIRRFFGPYRSDDVLTKIKAIFVSHLHADHHIGLIGLLQGRRKAIEKLQLTNVPPLLLLAPKQILTWLNFYDKYFEGISKEFELISNCQLLHDEHTLFEGTEFRVNLTLEMAEINTAYVRHCPNAFGVSFKHKNGYKICYSGDTMPAENLINIGANCDLLIHEATMEDELEDEALMKMHSTTSQAIEVGENMNAKHILLTHFSQRYAKLPRFNDNFRANVGIAFDNMQVRLDELPLVPLLYPALKIMFSEHYEELECKALKRQLKQDLLDAPPGEARSFYSPSSEDYFKPSISTQTASPIISQTGNPIPNRAGSSKSSRSGSPTPKRAGSPQKPKSSSKAKAGYRIFSPTSPSNGVKK